MMIRYNNTNVHSFGSFDGKDIKQLTPGWNEFPSSMWDVYKNHPQVVKMLQDNIIQLLNEPVVVNQGKKKITKHIGMTDEPLNLKDLSEQKAVEIVTGTLNRSILQRWIDEENRHKVKRALEKQIKPLLPEQKAE